MRLESQAADRAILIIVASNMGTTVMTQTFAIAKAVASLSLVEEKFGLVASSDEQFFREWFENLPQLSDSHKQALDRLKWRFLAHRKQSELSEGAVDRLLVSPLLDLAGLDEAQFTIDTEVPVEIIVEDEDELYRGKIDILVIKNRFWVLVIEEKTTRVATESAIPQGLAYLANSPNLTKPVFGLVTNGYTFIFIKLQQRKQLEYAFSDSFSLLSRQNQLYNVLQILKRIGDCLGNYKL